MAIENWLTAAEMKAIGIIVTNTQDQSSLGETGGDVLRIPMSKLKRAGYAFRGCDIAGEYKSLPALRNSFQKIDMGAMDTEESIESLSKALASVLAEMKK